MQDKPGAKALVASKCTVEFDDVCFAYSADSPVIKGISFTCPGGQTLALVGATGEILLLQCTQYSPAGAKCLHPHCIKLLVYLQSMCFHICQGDDPDLTIKLSALMACMLGWTTLEQCKIPAFSDFRT